MSTDTERALDMVRNSGPRDAVPPDATWLFLLALRELDERLAVLEEVAANVRARLTRAGL